jgi:uncharacterized membrane protein YgcG
VPFFRAGDFGGGLVHFADALNAKLKEVDQQMMAVPPAATPAEYRGAGRPDAASGAFAIGRTLDRAHPSVLAVALVAGLANDRWLARRRRPACRQCGVRSGVRFARAGIDVDVDVDSGTLQGLSNIVRGRELPWKVTRLATWELPGERCKAYECSKCGFCGRHAEFIPSGQQEEALRATAAVAAAVARRRASSQGGDSPPGSGASRGSSSGGGGGVSW